MGLSATISDVSQIGWFRIFVTPPGGDKLEITVFRDVPVQVGGMGTSDPFGETSCSLVFPQISAWDRPGQGDLHWLVPYANIDIVWHNMDGYDYSWEWEGFIIDESVSVNESDTSYTVECKGALYQLDNYLARPSFPQQPIPYEQLIEDAFDPETHIGSYVEPLRVIWPEDWNVTVPEFTTSTRLWFLRPYGVTPGQKWTGLSTRSTGAWDPTLSTFVQGLLTVMFDESGAQWTIRKDRGRVPVLYLRRQPDLSDPDLLTVKLGNPGVSVQFSRDFTQSANVIYGVGQDVAGSVFSGAQVIGDGSETDYEPFAYSSAVHPDVDNPLFNENITRKETQIQFPTGMDELTARDVAQAQFYRFADPGFTGQITLRTDPKLQDGSPYPRMLIKAGRAVLVQGFRGGTLLAHISSTEFSAESGEITLTVDSKFRDALTVQEVRERTRDALTPLRLLKPGAFQVTTQDMLLPWSYSEGSGCMPVGSKDLFTKKASSRDRFPYERLTTKYPPKRFPQYYVKIRTPNLSNPNKNWATRSGSLNPAGIPIRMAQQGTIRLSQIAAYDRDGNVLPVRFHISIYDNRGIGVSNMPMIPDGSPKILKPPGASYPAGKYNPFFKNAFENFLPTGAQQSDEGYTYPQSAGFVMGWGNYYEPAGHSPGLQSRGAPKTGMLSDEQQWQFNSNAQDFDPYDPHMKPWREGLGMMYAMIYCDDRPDGYDGPVFFLGRFFRQEPGQ